MIISKLKKVVRLKRKIKEAKIISKNSKIDEKMMIFSSFAGTAYTCSPKAIYEYVIKQPEYKDYKFIWAFKKPEEKLKYFKDTRTEIIKYNSKEFIEKLSVAKYWIFNFKTPEYFIKKKDQVFIQCWHGTPLKRLGCDIQIEKGNKATELKDIHKSYINDAKKYNYFISPSSFATEKFISAFVLDKLKKENIIVEKGYPRNEHLFNYKEEEVEKIKKKLNIPQDKKVILYAPTFRDNQYQAGRGHTYKLGINLLRLKEELMDEGYIILMRLHYLVSNSIDISQFKNFVYDVSNYEDINDLYIISDMLITDYSSVFFDYANLKRPILFFMYDLEEYKNNIRDFYLDLNELPGPIVENEKDLIKNIRNIKDISKKYHDIYIKSNNKYNYLDNGEVTAKVVKECIN